METREANKWEFLNRSRAKGRGERVWGRIVREHPFCRGLCVSQGTQEKGRYAYTREVSGYQITSPLSSSPWLPLNTPFGVHFPLLVGKAYSTSLLKRHVTVALPEIKIRFLPFKTPALVSTAKAWP